VGRAALALLLLGACSRASQPHVESITVDAFEGGEVVSMSQAQLRQRLAQSLSEARFVVLSPGQVAPEGVTAWRLQLAAGLAEPDIQTSRLDVRVVIRLSGQGEPEGFEVRSHQGRAVTANDVEAIQGQVRDALDAALARAVREAKALIELARAKEEEVAAKLGDGDEAVRDAAVRVLARRRSEAAVPALLEWLKSEDLQRVRAAVGLLVELRATRAVNAMIEAASARGPMVQREVIFAAGSIGGEDAEAYLDLVASGHDDPRMREAAEQALAELRSRPGSKKGATR
jgi:hypothetical protein